MFYGNVIDQISRGNVVGRVEDQIDWLAMPIATGKRFDVPRMNILHKWLDRYT